MAYYFWEYHVTRRKIGKTRQRKTKRKDTARLDQIDGMKTKN
jgi:hypothetical protein